MYLIGPRGCGKTTVGQQLAKRLGWAWNDLDQLIQEAAGRSIAEIFSQQGQTAFRDLESEQLQNQAHQAAQVVSLGGGAVLRQENQQLIRQTGFVIFLNADIDSLVLRVAADPHSARMRPALIANASTNDTEATTDDLPTIQRKMRDEMQQVLALRMPIYQQTCDLQLDTTNLKPDAIVGQIVRWLPHVDRKFAELNLEHRND